MDDPGRPVVSYADASLRPATIFSRTRLWAKHRRWWIIGLLACFIAGGGFAFQYYIVERADEELARRKFEVTAAQREAAGFKEMSRRSAPAVGPTDFAGGD